MYRVKCNRCIQGWFRRRKLYERNAWYIYITLGTNDLEKTQERRICISVFSVKLHFFLGHTLGTAEQVYPMGYT